MATIKNRIFRDHRDRKKNIKYAEVEECDLCGLAIPITAADICDECSTHRHEANHVSCKKCTPDVYTIEVGDGEYCVLCIESCGDDDEFKFCEKCMLIVCENHPCETVEISPELIKLIHNL